MLTLHVDWDEFNQEDYLGHKEKEDRQYAHFYELWHELRQKNVTDATDAIIRLRRLIDKHGAEAADYAVFTLTGSETATDLVDVYDKGDYGSSRWFDVYVASPIDYFATQGFSAADCRDNVENCLLGDIWAAERQRPDFKAAVDDFCVEFFGYNFADLFAMA